MESSLGGPPRSVAKPLSKANGKNFAKGGGLSLDWLGSQIDQALIQRSLRLMRIAIRVVKKALPDTDPELIGGFFANLLDLWETGQTLERKLQKLTKLRFPRDREGLRDILIWTSAIQCDMASFWIEEVKKDLPKLYRALDRLERKSGPGKLRRKLASARSAGKRKAARRQKGRFSSKRSHQLQL